MILAKWFWRGVGAVLSHPPVLRWLIARGRRRPYTNITSADGKEIYMERLWLFNPYRADTSGAERLFPISIRLHHIRRPDDDRDLHDHPWNARTIVLKGWYYETREDGEMWPRWMGETATLRFGEYHRIDYVPPDGVWTLFITGRHRGTWGFKVNGRKVPWWEYVK